MQSILRVILHWTAGGPKPSTLDRQHYHVIVDQAGVATYGDHPFSANEGPLVSGRYAAHTASFNTGSIGLALCGMAGAQERPFDAGRYPLTEAQVEAAAQEAAELLTRYGLPCTRDTCFTHAEAEPLHGVKQAGKWDITWLPGMDAPGDPIEVGDRIRAMVQAVMDERPVFPPVEDDALTADRIERGWRRIQKGLRDLGKNPGEVDGVFGPRTKAAMQAAIFNPPRA